MIGDDINASTTDLQIDFFQEAAKSINRWLVEWGGLEGWNNYLKFGYRRSRESGELDQWCVHVQEHAYRGRLLAQMLNQMELYIPHEMWKIRELWRHQTELVVKVTRALTLLEVHLDGVQSTEN